MGNQLAGAPLTDTRTLLGDLENFAFFSELGGTRLLKTLQCVREERHVCVKIYCKRDERPLSTWEKKFVELRVALEAAFTPSLLPYPQLVETRKAGYLIRQHFAFNLYDRFSTHPFLTTVEKKWFAFQLLHALCQMHENGVCHGTVGWVVMWCHNACTPCLML